MARAEARETYEDRVKRGYQPATYSSKQKAAQITRIANADPDGWIKIRSKYTGICGLCSVPTKPGDQLYWQAGRKNARHTACHESHQRNHEGVQHVQ